MGRFFLTVCVSVLPALAAAQDKELFEPSSSKVLTPMRLELRDAMLPEAKKGGSAAISGEIWNVGDEDVVLTDVASTSAAKVLFQVYDVDKNGLRFVETLPTLTIPAKKLVELTPAKREIRLVALNEDLVTGNEIALVVKDRLGRAKVWRVRIIKGYAQ